MDRAAEILFGKTRRALLSNFMLEPRGYRLRELERITGISSGSIQHELSQLMKAGIVLRQSEHGQILYRANTQSQIFAELRTIVEKTMGGPKVLRDALLAHESEIQFAFIYGSTARGTSDFESDIDLLVVGDLPYTMLIGALQPAETQLRRPINAQLLSATEFKDKVAAGDRFIKGILGKPIDVILGKDPRASKSGKPGS